METREALYKRYLNGEFGESMLKSKMKEALTVQTEDYLKMLLSINFITQSQKAAYSSKINAFLNQYIRTVHAQLQYALAHNLL